MKSNKKEKICTIRSVKRRMGSEKKESFHFWPRFFSFSLFSLRFACELRSVPVPDDVTGWWLRSHFILRDLLMQVWVLIEKDFLLVLTVKYSKTFRKFKVQRFRYKIQPQNYPQNHYP